MGGDTGLPLGRAMPFEPGGNMNLDSLRGMLSSMLNPGEALAGKARIILTDIPVDGREAQRILPFGVKMENPPRARLFICSYGSSVYSGPYHEASLILNVRTFLGSGGHVCWMVVDDDTALILGRELLACPKKLAQIRLDEENGRVSASVSRRGIDVIRAEAEVLEAEPSPYPVFDERVYNVGGPGQAFVVSPVWCLRLGEVIITSHSARGKVYLGDSVYDPLARVVGKSQLEVPMRIATTDISLVRYMFPVGLAGPAWAIRTDDMRCR